jgi:serine/threonine protein kinase
MALSPGEKLGPYEVLAAIGAGGMGEVYKARDTRLDRTVAIKVLPEHIAKREDLRARFEREARAIASLNHPHICTLYDIGNQDGAGYMVMEYMEGETLAAHIKKGALPLDQALKFATQMADALDRAHRAGVTHRDVKPQNIMLTRDGVKILDFGLAKSAPKIGPAEETLTALTTEGTVLGTPQYMAPEQFEGKEADSRSDIWSINTATPSGRFFFHVMASLAQMERELIVERTCAGLEAARRLGRTGGRKRRMTDSKIQSARKLLASGTPPKEVAKNLGVSVPTLYRWIPAGSNDSPLKKGKFTYAH